MDHKLDSILQSSGIDPAAKGSTTPDYLRKCVEIELRGSRKPGSTFSDRKEAMNRAVRFYREIGDEDRLLRLYKTILRSPGTYGIEERHFAAIKLADILGSKEKYDDALRALKKAYQTTSFYPKLDTEIYSSEASIHYDRAMKKDDRDSAVKAVMAATKAIKTREEQDCSLLHSLRGSAKIKLGNGEGAISDLEKATQLDPSFVRTWKTLAVVYDVLGYEGQAANAFREVVSIVSNKLVDQRTRDEYRDASYAEQALRELGQPVFTDLSGEAANLEILTPQKLIELMNLQKGLKDDAQVQ
ncbi:MAG: hypothetical protein JSW08_01685 [archaeon]|nr:MAG: hypothetical protein JSW08_01685 [archaeon]